MGPVPVRSRSPRPWRRRRSCDEEVASPSRNLRTMSTQEAFDYLGIHRSSSKSDANKAFRARVKAVHPDKVGEEGKDITAKLIEARGIVLSLVRE